MNKLLVALLALLTNITYSQNNQKQFSLQEAITYALENNYKVKNALRDIETAKQQKRETTATGLPQISAKVDYNNFIKQQVSLLPASAFDPFSSLRLLEQFYDLDALKKQSFPPPADGFVPVVFGTKQSMNANATLSQLIFNGSYLVGLQSAKVYLEISENAKIKTDIEVRKAVINAYGNVLMAEESIKILKRNLDAITKNITETTKLFENGFAEEESIEQLSITKASLESNLKNVRRLRTLSYQMLNITLGRGINDTITLSDNLENLTTQNMSLNLLSATNNIEEHIDYKIAFNDKKAKELLVKLEQSNALPSLNAFLNAGYNGNSNTFTFFDNDQQWFGSALVGVTLNIPIFSSFSRAAKVQRAKINFEKSAQNLIELEEQLNLQIASAKTNFKFATDDYENKKLSLNLAEHIEKKNQTKFFEGVGSSFELRQAQMQLYASQQELLQAMLEVINKKADLETALNTVN